MKIIKPDFSPAELDTFKSADLFRSLNRLRFQLEGLNLSIEIQRNLDHLLDNIDHAAGSVDQTLETQKLKIAEVEKLAMTDELTKIFNRRGFETQLERIFAAANRYRENGVIVYIDLDNFKPINDTYGHMAGDEILRMTAKLLDENIRATDFVGRLGGDEFAVALTRTQPEEGIKRAKILENFLNTSEVRWQGNVIKLHATFGCASYGPGDNRGDIINRADKNMYKRKKSRENTIDRQISA